MKIPIVISCGPKNNDEAAGRAFNALALAAEGRAREDESTSSSSALAHRGPGEFTKLSYPANQLQNTARLSGLRCGEGSRREFAVVTVCGGRNELRQT